jgi:hypothetical protein
MHGFHGLHRQLRYNAAKFRQHRFESLEDRAMLTVAADVVFLVDNSSSDGELTARWLRGLIVGDTDYDGVKDSNDLSERLAGQGIADVRYGLVAFGEQYEANNSARLAHSEVVDTDASKSVFDRLF